MKDEELTLIFEGKRQATEPDGGIAAYYFDLINPETGCTPTEAVQLVVNAGAMIRLIDPKQSLHWMGIALWALLDYGGATWLAGKTYFPGYRGCTLFLSTEVRVRRAEDELVF